MGLIGSKGFCPLADWLKAAREVGGVAVAGADGVLVVGVGRRYPGGVDRRGAGGRWCAIAGRWQRAALGRVSGLWLSICTAGQDFLSFQWDLLLVETGLLAVFAGQSRIRVWLFRWLAVPPDVLQRRREAPERRSDLADLTAMRYHYETQPLPTPLAWYHHQLPLAAQKASTAMTCSLELLVPLLFFGTRPVRRVGGSGDGRAAVTDSGHGELHVLQLADDRALYVAADRAAGSGRRTGMSDWGLAGSIGLLSAIVVLELDRDSHGRGAHALAVALPRVNSYGLFAVMTTERPEIIVEGSDDGVEWKAYEFRYKPGDVRSRAAGGRAAPASIGLADVVRGARQLPVEPLVRELHDPAVAGRAFGDAAAGAQSVSECAAAVHPGSCVSVSVHGWGSRDWWTREERGSYFPAVSLK